VEGSSINGVQLQGTDPFPNLTVHGRILCNKIVLWTQIEGVLVIQFRQLSFGTTKMVPWSLCLILVHVPEGACIEKADPRKFGVRLFAQSEVGSQYEQWLEI